jgi:hypothetical protein
VLALCYLEPLPFPLPVLDIDFDLQPHVKDRLRNSSLAFQPPWLRIRRLIHSSPQSASTGWGFLHYLQRRHVEPSGGLPPAALIVPVPEVHILWADPEVAIHPPFQPVDDRRMHALNEGPSC